MYLCQKQSALEVAKEMAKPFSQKYSSISQ